MRTFYFYDREEVKEIRDPAAQFPGRGPGDFHLLGSAVEESRPAKTEISFGVTEIRTWI